MGPKHARLVYDELAIKTLEGLRKAAEGEKLRELNAYPERLDLSGIHCRRVKEIGSCKVLRLIKGNGSSRSLNRHLIQGKQ